MYTLKHKFYENILTFNSPKIMAIVNVAEESFCNVGRVTHKDNLLYYAEKCIQEGADIIDIGGEPTNPHYATTITVEQELDRVLPAVEMLARYFSIPLSVDTSQPSVMQAVVSVGAQLINDVRAFQLPDALSMVVKLQVPVIVMHSNYFYDKKNSYNNNDLNIIHKVKAFLSDRIRVLVEAGVAVENIIIDPGIGAGKFGKTTQQNLHLIHHLNKLQDLGRPILIGVSRKTFIGDILKLPVTERLYGSIAATLMALMQGVSLVRTHDVKATADALTMFRAIVGA